MSYLNYLLACFSVIVSFLLIGNNGAMADSIIPDGSTSTTVSSKNGRTIVNIAKPDIHRVSVNNYKRFNVTKSGVSLDNTSVAARTIVNDVTGHESSLIEGEFEVLGTRAHVIIANRNGIKVNGGRFVNNADLILTTGSVGSVDRVISSGVTQKNITLDTSSGEVVIGEGGLSGAFNTLDVLSQSIKINGAIVNANQGLRNVVRFSPGKSKAELDTSLSPSNPVRAMATIKQSNNADNKKVVLFEVSQQGSISSGSISIAVTADGAGFKHAGSMNALSGDVNIDVNGLLQLEGDIVAQRHVKLSAKSVEIYQKKRKNSITQSVIQAKKGAIVIQAEKRFINKGGVVRGYERDVNTKDSKGAVTITSEEVINNSQSADALSVLFGENDDLSIRADKIENNTGRLVSNKKVMIDVGYLNNHIDVSDFVGKGEWQVNRYSGKRLWYALFLKKEKITEKSIDYGANRLTGQLAYITGDQGVEIRAKNIVNKGGEINSNSGNVMISTETLNNLAQQTGQLNLVKTCGIRCKSYGESTVKVLGGNINAGDRMLIDASQYIKNTGGQIYSINDLNIKSPIVKSNSYLTHNVVNRNRGISGLDMDRAFIYRLDQGGSLISNMGSINLDTLDPVEVNGGKIQADNGKIKGGVKIIREPKKELAVFGEHIGHFDWLFH